MIRKTIAILVFVMVFFVYFIDETYKLEGFEWVPEVLGAIMIAAAFYIWNPSQFRKRPDEKDRVDGAEGL